MLSEMSQAEKDKYGITSHVCGIFFLKKPQYPKQHTQPLRKRDQACGY